MAWITDSLRSAIGAAASLNPFARGAQTALAPAFTHQLALAAYMSSGMLRKTIAIPAADRTQKWRDWQAEKDTITLIEAEEKRLGLAAKTKAAEVLRGVGGGAMILVTAGDHDQPLNPETIRQGGLIAINVVSRWQITAKDFDRNLASPTYGEPRMFEVSDGQSQQAIHPSRVVCFRGEPIPQGNSVSDEDAFWGDARLLRVFNEVRRSDETQEWFASLVRKAKLLRIGIPDLLDLSATEEGRRQLDARVALIAAGESTLNATVYRSGSGSDDPGEKIDDYQISWAGIPAMMDAFDQRVAAVSDIPFTRLTGRSPAGMNSTGKHDTDNWNRAIRAGQENETRPCLEQIDPLLLRSAGVPEGEIEDVWWRWAPLDEPDEKENAETFKILMEAVERLQLSGLVPEVALSKAVENLIEERGDLPGLADALAELSEEERFGGSEEEDDDPSALQVARGGGQLSRRVGGGDPAPARRAANDAAPRTLYVSRKVQNTADLKAWARAQGLPEIQDDLHVTIAYSRTPVDWIEMGSTWADYSGKGAGDLVISAGGPRVVEPLGDRTAVLMFASSDLSWRNMEMREKGASWDWPDYQPHISLTGEPVDLANVEPYRGKIALGPEIFEEIREGGA